MSEYWKSTPKYWCKHCKTFVKDTKLEKTNHDATPKHQGNIKRFLRDLHRGHEREERDKQRAKNEVQRLNGVVSGSEASGAAGAPWRRTAAIPPPTSTLKQATPEERKRQLTQLAEMGVAVPEEFRKELAMAGEWETISETPIYETGPERADQDGNKFSVMNIGVRKRKYEGLEEEEEAGETVVRKGWGSTTRVYPSQCDEDLDSLLGKTKMSIQRTATDAIIQPQRYPRHQAQNLQDQFPERTTKIAPEEPIIKTEDPELPPQTAPSHGGGDGSIVKSENAPEPEIMFKKRKSKPIRHK